MNYMGKIVKEREFLLVKSRGKKDKVRKRRTKLKWTLNMIQSVFIFRRRFIAFITTVVLAILPIQVDALTATHPTGSADRLDVDEGPNDPLEPLNRLTFAVNELLDFVVIRPVAEIYRAIFPETIQHGITNVLDNLFAPVVFFNHVLQGEAERATVTVFRFLTNSTFGLFGLVDVTTELGFPRYDTDFNQTLMAWGVDTGPYLILPLIGPSSFRGTIGYVADYYADPLNIYLNNRHHFKYHYWLTVRYGLYTISQREKLIETLDNLRNSSPDFYVTMRSIYFQRQAYIAEKLKVANNMQQNTQPQKTKKTG